MRELGIEKVLKHCNRIRECDDALGEFSDHEGNQDGPAWWAWNQGAEFFDRRCTQAILAHQNAIREWRKFQRLNTLRK